MKKVEKYDVIISDTIQYKIIVKFKYNTNNHIEERKYTLKRSNSDIWLDYAKGEKLLEAKDEGNGIIFKKNIKPILEYDQFFELSIFLNFIFNNDKTITETYKIIKS